MNYLTTLYKILLHNHVFGKCKQFLYHCSSSQRTRRNAIRIFSILFLGLASVSLQAGVITHNISSGNLTISGTSTDDYIITGSTSTNRVIIESGYKGNVTLRNLTIKSEPASHNTVSYSPFTVLGQNNCSNLAPVTKVNIILEGKNELLYTGAGYACLQVNQGAQIHISAIDPNDNSSGTLSAKATRFTPGSADIPIAGAGIGAPTANGLSTNDCIQGTSPLSCGGTGNTAGGNILISSGEIVAWGGHASGIGGGYRTYYNGIIIIYGGEVEARGGYDSAGIGSGCPTGSGVLPCYADQSTVIALPPATIEAYGAGGHAGGGVGTGQFPELGLTGTKNITYLNDPNKSLIKVRTADYEPNANIYLDLTETTGLVDIFNTLKIDYDLKKVKVGKTDASGYIEFRAQLEQNTTFFTDASSSNPAHSGRPYMPVSRTVIGNKDNTVEVVLPLLDTDIAFTDYPSTPLEVGYTATQSKENAHCIKVEYRDASPMTNVTYKMQGGEIFNSMIFLGPDRSTVITTPPTQLNKGDVFYIVLPIKTGQPQGAYSDVLLIHGYWKSASLPGYIRRVGEQRVVLNDTKNNTHIKVTASPNKEVYDYPTKTSNNVQLNLNINHTGILDVPYDPKDVTAKYLITTEPDYDKALLATPLKNWSDLNIPATENTNRATTASFYEKEKGVYYIHWYVVSGVVYAHSQSITNPPRLYGGFGPYIIAAPVQTEKITGNPSVCSGQIPSEIKGEASTGGSGDFSYQWQMSTDNGTSWVNVGTNSPNYAPGILTKSPTYYRRQTKDNKYGGTYNSNVFIITINTNDILYWKKNATNRNWNDPTNWVNASGVAQNMVPLSCTDVYIPNGAAIYPSLDPKVSPTDIYGSPICKNITFAYGAELAYQQNLIYEKAKVQYNFGYYSTMTSGAQPNANKDATPSINMKRDQWYPLAAPLKKMASGDFSFGGYPFVWQALPDAVSGENNFYSINFNKTNGSNEIDLSTTNNSIVVKTALYKAGATGYSDQKNLQALKGVLEIPYFDNLQEAAYHSGHSYDSIAKRSTFYYFNSESLQQLYSPVGKMSRGNEAFRFIYEGQTENVIINGKSTLCYLMKVSPNSGYKHALIGNPLMATINMKNFYDVNSSVLENSNYYAYDNSGNGTWMSYGYLSSNGVNSLQAFIAVFKTNAANQTLRFPLDGDYALTGSVTNKIPRRIELPGALSVKASNENGEAGDYAELSPVNYVVENDLTQDVRKLIGEESHSTPEVFFINRNATTYNLMQIYKEGETVIDLGIRCSDTKTPLTLSFDKVQEFAKLTGTTPILVDKYLNIRQDLTLNSTYTFKQQPTDDGRNKYTDVSRYSILLKSSDDSITENGVDVAYLQGSIVVNSTQGITNVKVYNMLGQLIHDSKMLRGNDTFYRRSIGLQKGSYIVKVSTIDNKSVSSKIMATDY